MKPEIRFLFEPRSVAVVGASHNREKIGYKILENIISSGYKGKTYPINPKGGELFGMKVYESILGIEGEVDLVFIAIPSEHVFSAVRECAEKKARFLAIITSGFSEVGKTREEKEIVEYAASKGMRILGPNIFGLYSRNASLNATFGARDVRPGGVAIITQSGALGISMMGKTAVEDIGLSAMVSVGNKSDLDEADLLEYLIEDNKTGIIMMYVEGIRGGEKLVPALKKASLRKPVIVLKSGRSKRGAMAAASHTGSLAGSDKIFSNVMEQCNVLRAETIHEALRWCKYMSFSPPAEGENTLIITNGGGMGVLAADACEKYGVSLYDDVSRLRSVFSSVVPSFGSVKNPVDLTGQATIEDYERSIEAALKSKDIHSIICLGCETAFFEPAKLSRMIESFYSKEKPQKPIVFSFFGGKDIESEIERLGKKDIPIFSDVYHAVSCIGAVQQHYRSLKYPALFGRQRKQDIDYPVIDAIVAKAKSEGRTFLLPMEAKAVMEAAKIPFPESRMAKSLDSAVKRAEEIGYPVALKIASKDIIHKSDVGGVALSLDSRQELVDAYEAVMLNAKKNRPDAVLEGVEVAEMVEGEVEIIAGAIRDKSFGPVIMVGLGGIYVEVMDDVSFRAYPASEREVAEMISEIKAYHFLVGFRGEPRKDIKALSDTLTRIGSILKHCPDISDLEINPVIVKDDGGGVIALDVRVLLSVGDKG